MPRVRIVVVGLVATLAGSLASCRCNDVADEMVRVIVSEDSITFHGEDVVPIKGGRG